MTKTKIYSIEITEDAVEEAIRLHKLFGRTGGRHVRGQKPEPEATDSHRNGDALAAECRDGISRAASPLKTIRFRATQRASFTAGSVWA